MDRIPLLTTNELVAALDVTPLLTEHFQEELNIEVSRIANKHTEQHFKEYEDECKLIDSAEKEIMEVQAKFLIDNFTETNVLPSVNMKGLRKKQLQTKLSESTINKFGLIDVDKLFKPYEKLFLFPNDYSEYSSSKQDYKSLPEQDKICFCSTTKSKNLGDPFLHSSANKGRIYPADGLNIKDFESSVEYRRYKRLFKSELKFKPTVFVACPNEIKFKDCELGKTYTAYFTLQNAGNISKKFYATLLSSKSAFKFDYYSSKDCQKMIAPGIVIKFVVQFTCYVEKDFYNEINFFIEDSPGVRVQLRAVREAPTLKVLPSLSANVSDARFHILTHSIECGVSLIGEDNVLELDLYNDGSPARFFIVPEEDWALQEIVSVSASNKLVCSSFNVSPAYFIVGRNKSVKITIVFSPREFGFFTQKLFIMCDNSTVTSIDLLGEGIVFEPSHITFSVSEKTFPAKIDDDPSCSMFILLNTLTCSGYEQYPLVVYSKCMSSIKCHWELAEFCSSNKHVKLLPHNCIRISPSNSYLNPLRENNFTLEVKLDNMPPGSYRTVLCFFIDHLNDEKVYYNCKDKLMPDPDLWNMKLEICRIEVWLECKRAEIMIVPYILEFDGEPEICSDPQLPVSEINVTNLSVSEVECYWEIPDCCAAVIKITPVIFTIPVNENFICEITINLDLPGKINHAIRCVVNNGESCSNIIVCCTIIQVSVDPEQQLYDFDVKQKDTDAECTINFTNLCYNRPFLRCHELKFNFDNRRQHMLHKMPDDSSYVTNIGTSESYDLIENAEHDFWYKCFLGDVKSKGSFVYNLDTNVEKIHCSLIQMNVEGVREYIAIIADIQKPLLSFSDCWLPIVNDMLLYDPIVVSLMLRNHSALSVPFSWGHPLGQQQHDFLVKIKPMSDIILPRTSIEINFKLLPQKPGVKTSLLFPCFLYKIKDPLLFVLTGLVKTLTVNLEWINGTNDQKTATWPKFIVKNKAVDWDTFKQTNNLETTGVLCPFSSYTKNLLMSQENLPWFKQDRLNESVHIVDDIRSRKSSSVSVSPSNIIQTEQKLPSRSDSSDSDLSGIYQNYPIISGKYVINKKSRGDDDRNMSVTEKETVLDDGEEVKIKTISFSDKVGNVDEKINTCLNDKAVVSETLISAIELSKVDDGNVKNVEVPCDKPSICMLKNVLYDLIPLNLLDCNESACNYKTSIDVDQRFLIFDDVKCWKATNKAITMKCYTPEKTIATFSVKHYKPKKLEKTKIVIDLTKKLKDPWFEKIPKGEGLIIVPTPCICTLSGHDVVRINLWVYADTWGLYKDILVIKVGYLPAMHVGIIVNVCDNPIIFPSLVEPIIRFGVLTFNGARSSYNLRICNNCSADVVVKWSVYLRDYFGVKNCNNFYNDNIKNKPPPFEVSLMDIEDCDKQADSNADYFKLVLTPYYGKRDFDIYTLNKTELFLAAWNETVLEITVNPAPVKSYKASLNAVLIGHVGKIGVVKNKSVEMPSSHQLDWTKTTYKKSCKPIVKLDISASLEFPKLKLLNLKKIDLIFKVSAVDIMKCSESSYSVERTFTFANISNAFMKFSVTVQKPFRLLQIDTLKVTNFSYETSLSPNEVCECKIQLTLTKQLIQELISQSPLLPPKTREEANKPPHLKRKFNFSKDMNIKQDGLNPRQLALEYIILFPELRLSDRKIMYGAVYIKSTVCKQFFLFTADPVAVYFEIEPSNKTEEEVSSIFEFVPCFGYIQPKVPFEIRVYFTPAAPADYKKEFVIKTAVPNHEVSIYLIGSGTFDYKRVHYDSHM